MKYLVRSAFAMAVAILSVSVASAQRPGGAGGFTFGGGAMNAHSLVATNAVLQTELKVTDEQKTKLTEAMKPIAVKRTELFGARGGAGGRPAGGQRPMITDEQRKEMAEKMAKLTEETKKAVEGVLEPAQTKRLNQIGYQMMGFAAFTNAEVQEKLKLDDTQKEKLKSINEEYTKDSAELRRDAPRGGRRPGAEPSEEDQKRLAEYNKKRDALRTEAEDKAKEVLSADQKKVWTELLGEKFDTAKLFQRPTRRDN